MDIQAGIIAAMRYWGGISMRRLQGAKLMTFFAWIAAGVALGCGLGRLDAWHHDDKTMVPATTVSVSTRGFKEVGKSTTSRADDGVLGIAFDPDAILLEGASETLRLRLRVSTASEHPEVVSYAMTIVRRDVGAISVEDGTVDVSPTGETQVLFNIPGELEDGAYYASLTAALADVEAQYAAVYFIVRDAAFEGADLGEWYNADF